MGNIEQNNEIIDRIKSLELLDKEKNEKISEINAHLARLAVSTELMQEAVTKLAEVKEQVVVIHSSLVDKINELNVRLTQVESGYSGAKFVIGSMVTTICGILIGKYLNF